MRQPQLRWEKSGRSQVACVGRLSLVVSPRPHLFGDRLWHVREVFGNSFVDSTDYASVSVAEAAAERVARKLLRQAAREFGLVVRSKIS